MSATEGNQFVFQCAPSARQFLLGEGTDQTYGARHLKRAIERYLVFPLSNLLATRQIKLGDLVTVEFNQAATKLVFFREAHGALVGGLDGGSSEKALEPASVGSGRARVARAGRGNRDWLRHLDSALARTYRTAFVPWAFLFRSRRRRKFTRRPSRSGNSFLPPRLLPRARCFERVELPLP